MDNGTRSVVGMTMAMEVAMAVAVAVAVALLLLLRSFNNWYFGVPNLPTGVRLPPGDLGLPVVGEMPDFLRHFSLPGCDPERFIQKRLARYGKVGAFRSHLFGRKSIIPVSPEMIKFVMGDDDAFEVAWPGSDTKNAMHGKKATPMLRGAEHTRARKYVTTCFASPPALRACIPCVTNIITAALDKWAEAGTVVLQGATQEMMFDIIAVTILSWEPGVRSRKLEHDFEEFMKGVRATPIYFPGTTYYKAAQARKAIVVTIATEIRDRRAKTDTNKQDFMQAMMDAVDDDGLKMTDEELSDNMVGTMLAAFMSTAITMLWVATWMARYPEMLQKLREEHWELRKSKEKGQLLTLHEIKNLTHYTSNVITETLRVSSLAAMAFKRATRDVDYKGFRIPKGWMVLPWFRAAHMDPDFYADPQKFNPDRWDTPEASRAQTVGAYQAFGSGPRKCPGQFIAVMNVTIFLHYLCLDYNWENVNPNELAVQYLPHPKPKDGGKIRITPCEEYKL